MKKIGLWGSVASIIGLIVALTTNADSQTHNITGNQNAVIGNNSGSINVNYGQAQEATSSNQLILNNHSSGISLVTSEPSISTVSDESKHICNAIAGTPIKLTGKVANEGYLQFKQVQIIAGECQGKVGWVSSHLVAYK